MWWVAAHPAMLWVASHPPCSRSSGQMCVCSDRTFDHESITTNSRQLSWNVWRSSRRVWLVRRSWNLIHWSAIVPFWRREARGECSRDQLNSFRWRLMKRHWAQTVRCFCVAQLTWATRVRVWTEDIFLELSCRRLDSSRHMGDWQGYRSDSWLC